MELHQYTNKSLLEELLNRFDSCVFGGVKHNKVDIYYDGNNLICSGLCNNINNAIQGENDGIQKSRT